MALMGAGHFAGFTYIRPEATEVGGLAADQLAALLLVYGVGIVAGNLVAGPLADRRMRLAVLLFPAVLGAAMIVLVLGGGSTGVPLRRRLAVGRRLRRPAHDDLHLAGPGRADQARERRRPADGGVPGGCRAGRVRRRLARRRGRRADRAAGRRRSAPDRGCSHDLHQAGALATRS
jgi:hypothetical protein